MRAIVIDCLIDEPEALRVSEWPTPGAGPGEIVIDVRAAGCNFSDVLMLRGAYQVKPPLPFVLGREAAGVVSELGEGVGSLALGDRVLAFTDLGAFAEQVKVPVAEARVMPAAMSFETAAAIPIVYPTSYAALVDRAALRTGETLLVHAAAGGVGLAAIQIGKALGARIIATAGGAAKLEVARAAGADVLVDSLREDFVETVLDVTNGLGADVIYDSVGGETTDRSLKCIAWKGRLLVVGFAAGTIPEIRANRIMLKNISVVGLNWPEYTRREPATVDAIHQDLFALYEQGGIAPLIHAAHPLEDTGKALAELAARRTVGKVVVVP